jgi:hypothetical protein
MQRSERIGVRAFVVVGMSLAGCVELSPYKAYEGPDLITGEVAIVTTHPPGQDFADVEVHQINSAGIEYYSARKKNGNFFEISLVPGAYEVTLEGRCTSQWPLARRTFTAALRAGHSYEPKRGCCFAYVLKDSFCMWLEDSVTGEDVTGSKRIQIPRGSATGL